MVISLCRERAFERLVVVRVVAGLDLHQRFDYVTKTPQLAARELNLFRRQPKLFEEDSFRLRLDRCHRERQKLARLGTGKSGSRVAVMAPPTTLSSPCVSSAVPGASHG
jgi:hypothetical protein